MTTKLLRICRLTVTCLILVGGAAGGVADEPLPAEALRAKASPAEIEARLKQRDAFQSQLEAKLQAGAWPEAIEACERMMAVELEVFEADHPDVDGSRQWLAELQVVGGNVEIAQALARESVRIHQRIDGEEHWRTRNARELVEYVDTVGRMKPAELKILRQAESDLRRAQQLYRDDKSQAALELLLPSARKERHVLGDSFTAVANTTKWLGFIQRDLGHHDLACAALLEADAVYETRLGPVNPRRVACLRTLGRSRNSLGQYEAAAANYRKALAISLQTYGDKHTETRDTQIALGQCLVAWSRELEDRDTLPLAQAVAREGIEVYSRVYAAEDWRQVDLRMALGCIEARLGFSPEQQRLFEENRRLANETTALLKVKNYPELRQVIEDRLALCERLFGPEHYYTTNVMYEAAYAAFAVRSTDAGALDVALERAKRVLGLREKSLGLEHPSVGAALECLALVQTARDDSAAAVEVERRAHKIFVAARGAKHSDSVAACERLEQILEKEAVRLRAADDMPAYVRVRKELVDVALLRHAADRWQVTDARVMLSEAEAQARLPAEQRQQLKQSQAELIAALDAEKTAPLAELISRTRRWLQTAEQMVGIQLRDFALVCDRLAGCCRVEPNYGEALRWARRAVQYSEAVLGPAHPDNARRMGEVADLLEKQGGAEEAVPLLQRALKIRQDALGEEHEDTASSMNALAQVYTRQGRYKESFPLHKRTLEIREKVLGPEKAATGAALHNLAGWYRTQGRYAEATPLYERALKVIETVTGPTSLDAAVCRHSFAQVYLLQGNYDEALALFKRGLELCEQRRGPTHPDTALALIGVAAVHHMRRDYKAARPLLERSVEITRRNVEICSSGQSEREQLLMVSAFRSSFDALLTSMWEEHSVPSDAYLHALAWKGAVTARQRQMRQTLKAAGQDDPEILRVQAQLAAAARELSLLHTTVLPDVTPAELSARQLAAGREVERWEQELARHSVEFRQALEQRRRTPDELRASLPDNAVLIDLMEYGHYASTEESRKGGTAFVSQSRLVAFLVTKQQDVRWINLGPVAPIRDAVAAWRESYSPDDAQKIRRLVWDPLAAEIDFTQTKLVLLSPDGCLARFPWGALPGADPKKFLLEELPLAVVPVPSLLPELLASAPMAKQEGPPSLLLVGDLDYQGDPGQAPESKRAKPGDLLALAPGKDVRSSGWRAWENLSGFFMELAAIEKTYRRVFPGASPDQLSQDEGTKRNVAEAATKHQYLHFATHGFYDPPELQSMLGRNPGNSQASGADSLVGFHPDVLSGLALTGANREPDAEHDDGILTALEVASLDLQGVEMVTLSACQTGLGSQFNAEGLLGLQRALHVAGARTAVATLWSVRDDATRTLMTDFYRNLWVGKMTKLEALRQAQLKLMREGPNRGMDVVGTKRQLSPYYWAPFILSGDWR